MRISIAGSSTVCAAALLGVGAAVAEPQVTLTSIDGTTEVQGELIDFDGETYTVRTSLGTIGVPAAQVTCAGEGCPAVLVYGDRFAVAGSTTIGEGLMPWLVEGYADSLNATLVSRVGGAENARVFRLADASGRELVAIELAAHGSATTLGALADGAAAIGLASRRITDAEAALAAPDNAPQAHILALDGLIAIVHPDNPVRALTLDEIAAVFAGRIGNWSQLGGPDQAVSLYVRNDDSGTLDVFNSLVLEPRRLQIAEAAERLADDAELSDLVSIDPGAIGFTGFAFARAARVLPIRQSCGLISLPTSFTLKTEEYPLARRLYAYSAAAGMPHHATELLGFALSDAAQPLIAEAGFADRSIERRGIEVQGARLAHSLTSPEEFSLSLMREMLAELKDAERLSLTFRFTPGSSDLEPRSQSEAARFSRLLAAGGFSGKEVLLVGFTDSVGDFNANRGLAERRARSVRETLAGAAGEAALANVPILVQSYGELTPVGCNETAEGRNLNRRVEVWIRDRAR